MDVLTKENIAFIDRYLENSDVIFADIRMEMVDHIASDIEYRMLNGDERPFYEIFKEYMREYKIGLLESKRSTIKQLTKDLAIKALYKLILIPYLLGLIVFTILYFSCMTSFGIGSTVWIHLAFNLSLILVPALVYEYHRRRKNIPRFSGIERLVIMLSILIQVVFFTRNISGLYSDSFFWVYAGVFSVQLMITIAFINVGFEQFRSYKDIFNFG